MQNDCLFCRIVKGEIPSYKVYEDDDVLVILDRFPRNAGECLVITKEHYESLFDLDPALGAKIFDISRRAALRIKEAYPIEGLNLLQNNGEPAGQQIHHFHLHVIPRYKADHALTEGRPADYSEQEFEDAVRKLKL